MNILFLSTVRKAVVIAGASLLLSATPASAISFSISEGIQPANVGTVTLTQVNATTVNVFVDLNNAALPNSALGYGFINTGGPHTPFAFNLAGSETGVSATFLIPNPNTLFSLTTTDSGNTPFGTYGIGIDSSAGNGSGNAYYGDLSFNVIRASGLVEADFVANAGGWYFSADLTDGQNTGAQAWKTPGGNKVPDGGTTAVLLGLSFVGLSFFARRRSA